MSSYETFFVATCGLNISKVVSFPGGVDSSTRESTECLYVVDSWFNAIQLPAGGFGRK